ncbi:MAG TPA: serine hydrolase domain-containing protein [Acetobacteraceae bacterium]|nr:serine hydrolase domain-containing protein [Acetobacteraceae bacterium]
MPDPLLTRPARGVGRRGIIAAAAALLPAAAHAAPVPVPAPPTGAEDLGGFLAAFMKRWEIPTASIAVARGGRLGYALARGSADLAGTTKATPRHRFRIASSSKPITAVAVMRLVEQKRLRLDDHPFVILAGFGPPAGGTVDPRLRTITVRHLLEHSGGFDSTRTDPQFDALRVAADAFGRPAPASPADLVGWMMGQRLAFDPGTKYLYSNFGYNVLGRVIEAVSGMPYADFVAQEVMRPAGAGRIVLGRTRPRDRLADEVEYWDDPRAATFYSVYADDPMPRTAPYGAFSMEAIDAHGGFVASPIDLTRFLNAVAGEGGTQLLAPATAAEMLARPDLAQYRGAAPYYALGWNVEPGRIVMAHNGALTWGTSSVIGRLPGGITYAFCANRLPYDLGAYVPAMGEGIPAAVARISQWPAEDLYPQAG